MIAFIKRCFRTYLASVRRPLTEEEKLDIMFW